MSNKVVLISSADWQRLPLFYNIIAPPKLSHGMCIRCRNVFLSQCKLNIFLHQQIHWFFIISLLKAQFNIVFSLLYNLHLAMINKLHIMWHTGKFDQYILFVQGISEQNKLHTSKYIVSKNLPDSRFLKNQILKI